MNKIINPPCNSWKQATSIIMLDEKKKKNKSRVVVTGESSRHVEGSGAATDVGVSPDDQFSPDPPIVGEAIVSMWVVERRRQEWKTRARRLTTSQRLSLWVDLCQLLVANQRESHLKRQSGELVSFQRQRLHWMLLVYRLVSFQTSQYPITFY